MEAGAAGGRDALIAEIVAAVDPRRGADVLRELTAARALPPLEVRGHLVVVGHRAAGKTRLLPLLSRWMGWPGVDLDEALAREHGRPLVTWVAEDPASFRRAERELFQARAGRQVIAAGGGFLSLHADLLAGHTAVLIPVSFETYRERLLADTSRPRLRPHLPLEEEIAQVYRERELLHARSGALPLGELLARTRPAEEGER